MDAPTKIVAMRIIPDTQLRLHQEDEIQHLTKRGVLEPNILEYSRLLQEYIDTKNTGNSIEPEDPTQSTWGKGLSEIQKTLILNNSFANKAEMLLKVPATRRLNDKDIKAILDFKGVK